MVKRFGWLAAAAFLAAAPHSVLAQFVGDTELTKNWDLRIGVFVPQYKVAREAKGDAWLTLGAEHPFVEQERYKGTISLDYYGSGNRYQVPICLNLRSSGSGLRCGAGAGIVLGHDFEQGGVTWAYNLAVGYALTAGNNPVTVDVRYLGTGRSAGKMNGWAFTVGYVF